MRRYNITIVVLLVTTMLLVRSIGAKEKQKESVVPKEKIILWNGKDFTGWKLYVKDPVHDVTKTWSVKDGVIRCEGKPLNEGRRIAESTLAAIMGRMSAYTGRELKWDWAMNASELNLSPPKYEFSDLPVRPIAIPGKTQLV